VDAVVEVEVGVVGLEDDGGGAVGVRHEIEVAGLCQLVNLEATPDRVGKGDNGL
jgi:hypothetical protein